ncbi:hypothetical protein [Parasitella parasitica]|uniref:Uncharacterized protein n=1 Tax=Parasitella parasitica TaxID=35722 RepID=A0A0B7NM99_9FUNG|nr:hypothetical protein [Parasitella parasitica]
MISDLDWCIKHSDTLCIQTFSEVFNYGDKSSANKRYAQILKTKRFKSCVSNATQFHSAFDKWKRSQQETTFWENRKVELARQSAESRMRVSAIGALGRLGVEEGDRVAIEKSASSSDSEPSQSHAPEPMSDSEPSSSRSFVNYIRNKSGESVSLASSLRKNKDRIPQGEEKLERKKMGRCLDMILRKKNLELGAGEAGKATGDNDRKLLRERDVKLPKALKDMFLCLKNEGGDSKTPDIEVIGLLQYGLTMSMLRMDIPVNYVHRVRRTRVAQVPSDWKKLPDFRRVLYRILSSNYGKSYLDREITITK